VEPFRLVISDWFFAPPFKFIHMKSTKSGLWDADSLLFVPNPRTNH